MKILVVAAMPNELKAIKEGIKSAGLKEKLDIDYLCCGIGNYETISSLEHYLAENKEPTFIWNIGICGYWNLKNEKKFDPIQVASVINVHTKKELVIPPFIQVASLKNCFCGESVVYEKPEFGDKFGDKFGTMDDEMYFDMESRGIEFVASRYKYPRVILKIPFDFIGDDIDVKNQNFVVISEKISGLLGKLSYRDYLSKILDWIKQQKLSKIYL